MPGLMAENDPKDLTGRPTPRAGFTAIVPTLLEDSGLIPLQEGSCFSTMQTNGSRPALTYAPPRWANTTVFSSATSFRHLDPCQSEESLQAMCVPGTLILGHGTHRRRP